MLESRPPAAAVSGYVASGLEEDLHLRQSMRPWSTLKDGVMLLAVVWSIPVALLLVGAPVALAVALLLLLVRLVARAF
jgi:hypothetical protein